jgi:hypothetical protein
VLTWLVVAVAVIAFFVLCWDYLEKNSALLQWLWSPDRRRYHYSALPLNLHPIAIDPLAGAI